MSNLHVNLDEANKHDPKGFIPAVNNTFPVKSETGISYYEERMVLPKAINFVDGTVAPPTSADLDVYVLTGSGTEDAGWGTAVFGDWVRFLNGIPTPITPSQGYLCYDDTAAGWKEFDGSVWAAFGGGGADTNLGTDNLTLSGAVTRTYNVDGNELRFIDGANSRLKIDSNGVAVGSAATAANRIFSARSKDSLSTGSALYLENASAKLLFDIRNDGITEMKFQGEGLLIATSVTATTPSARLQVKGKNINKNEYVARLQDSNEGDRFVFHNNGNFDFKSVDSLNDHEYKLGNLHTSRYSAFIYENNLGTLSDFIWTGSTDSLGGNPLLTNSITWRGHGTASRMAIMDGTGGGLYFMTAWGATDANTDGKWTSAGLLIGDGIGASSPGARLHVIGDFRLDETTVLGKTISTDFLPINVNGTVRYIALYD